MGSLLVPPLWLNQKQQEKDKEKKREIFLPSSTSFIQRLNASDEEKQNYSGERDVLVFTAGASSTGMLMICVSSSPALPVCLSVWLSVWLSVCLSGGFKRSTWFPVEGAMITLSYTAVWERDRGTGLKY